MAANRVADTNNIVTRSPLAMRWPIRKNWRNSNFPRQQSRRDCKCTSYTTTRTPLLHSCGEASNSNRDKFFILLFSNEVQRKAKTAQINMEAYVVWATNLIRPPRLFGGPQWPQNLVFFFSLPLMKFLLTTDKYIQNCSLLSP